ncbi:hypothetical protein SH668x_000908 [Planctomicrobium sp. SH668]|uniref:hypothetical protein n=1 Tax=Planctomicrobium sp. SH668 TaxID=3448126 RepID=UPI003F5B14E9
MENQQAEMAAKVDSLDEDLRNARASLQAVNQTLQLSQGEITELTREVAHWKGEVQRLETEMKTQQLADLKSLDELTATMHQVLLRQQGTQTNVNAVIP